MTMPDVYSGPTHTLAHTVLVDILRLQLRTDLSHEQRLDRTADVLRELLDKDTNVCFCMAVLMLRKLMPNADETAVTGLAQRNADGMWEELPVDDAPLAVRSFTRFIAAVIRHDLDTAWAQWLVHFGPSPGPQAKVDGELLFSYVAGLFTSQAFQHEILSTVSDCGSPPPPPQRRRRWGLNSRHRQ